MCWCPFAVLYSLSLVNYVTLSLIPAVHPNAAEVKVGKILSVLCALLHPLHWNIKALLTYVTLPFLDVLLRCLGLGQQFIPRFANKKSEEVFLF